MPDEPVAVAILGYGVGGRVFHGPLLAATPHARVAAVVTGDPGRAAHARRAHPAAAVLATADELWDRAGELGIRLAVVTTTNATHVPLARAAVARGIAVVVDKPLAPTAAQGSALVAEAARAGVPLTVFHNRRLDGEVLTVQRLLADGSLGTVFRLESRFERWRPQPRPGSWREAGDPLADGAGMLLDLGAHLVDQAILLMGGTPRAVYAEVATRRRAPAAGPVLADDEAFVSLTFPGDRHAHLSLGLAFGSPGPRMRVLGTAGAYVKDDLDVQEDQLRAGVRAGSPGFGVEPPAAWGRLVRGDVAVPVPTARGEWDTWYGRVVAAVRAGGAMPVDAQSAVTVLAVLEAARHSARAGSVVDLPAGAG